MLFSSLEFIFAYLPVVFFGFFALGRISVYLAAVWLTAASLFFYAWWNPLYLGLLVASAAVNYGSGLALMRISSTRPKAILLGGAIAANLATLSYFKYADFFISSVNGAFGADWSPLHVILPLGISFFTFTQIAFLVDVYRGFAREYRFVHYLLFVTYFPHLIAGPVLHHGQMMPQLATPATYRISADNLAVGFTFFAIGLAKKVLIADPFGEFANPVFQFAESGGPPQLIAAWVGTLAFTMQLYFDFSGYSDMAVGLSRLFGIRLPFNFASPYKAPNIIEFWRRWHMTLSQFLRDYLYIPLGGSRAGLGRHYVNILVTMLLGGLWHGASWTYVAWGGLHGAYLIINHAWQHIADGNSPFGARLPAVIPRALSVATTFLCVAVGWVFFRASSFEAANLVLKGLVGLNGVTVPYSMRPALESLAIEHLASYGGVLNELAALRVTGSGSDFVLLLVIAFTLLALPNTQTLCDTQAKGSSAAGIGFRRPATFGLYCGVLFALSVMRLSRGFGTDFLYYQF